MNCRRRINPVFALLTLSVLVSASVRAHAEDDKPPQDESAIKAYRERAQTIEKSGGAMDPRLKEIYLDLGDAYRKGGDNDQAATAYERALYISRTQQGLENPAQIPIVEDLIGVYTALADGKALDKNYDYLHFLYKRNYGETDPRTIDVVLRIARWRLHAYQLDPNGTGLDHLVKADILYASADKALRDSKEDNGAQRVALLYHRAVVNYYIAQAAQDYHISIHTLRAALIDNDRPAPDVVEKRTRDRLEQDSEDAGEVAIRHLLEITGQHKDADPESYAHALMFAGDWNLALRRHWDAMRNYHEAWEALAASGMSPDQISKSFGDPRAIKPLTVPGDAPDQIPGHKYVDAVVDVPPSGWPTNIRVNDVHPKDDTDLSRRGRRAIAAVRYRPRFVNGEPVETDNVNIRYVFR